MAATRRQLPPLSPDAARIYRVLRTRVPTRRSHATITYMDLGQRVGIPHRGPRMDVALLELVRWCRTLRLPAIAALVVRADRGAPGPGYYLAAHGVPPRPALPAVLAWACEVAQVCATRYP